jgi:hypothetical protein
MGATSGMPRSIWGRMRGGIQVVDQWNNVDTTTRLVTGKKKPGYRQIEFNQPLKAMINRGESYHVVD